MAILNQDTTIGGVNIYDAIAGGGGGGSKVYGPVTTTGTGAAYVATIEDGPESLYTGLLLVIIPHVTSTSITPTLNVNSLGAKKLYLYADTNTYSTYTPGNSGVYYSNKPLLLMYDGSYFRVLNFNEVQWSNINDKQTVFDRFGTAAYTDFNAIPSVSSTRNAGWALVAGSPVANSPIPGGTQYWACLQFPEHGEINGNYCTQIAIKSQDSSIIPDQPMWIRHKVSGTWSAWNEIGRDIKEISISDKADLDDIVDIGVYLVNDSSGTSLSYYMMVSEDYNLGSTDRGIGQLAFGRMSTMNNEDYQRYMIHRRVGYTTDGSSWTWGSWTHGISLYENARYTSWSSLPPATGTYRVYASSGAPHTSYSNWAVSIYEVGASTESPTTKYFVQLAMRNSSSNAASDYDLYYRKCSYSGSSWSNGTWEKILTDNTTTISTSLRTTASVTTTSTTGYYRNIGVGTSAPSSLPSGQVFLVYEDA